MKCARQTCQNDQNGWYNHSTRSYYCDSCAALLNILNRNEVQVHDLCTKGSLMVSPDTVLARAKEEMLEGRNPETREDWLKIMNFMVVNCQIGLRFPVCKLMVKLYDMGLSDNDLNKIITFQQPFAVIASIPMRSYYVQENASGLLPGVIEGCRIVMSKFDTRKEADDFQQHCQNHPQRLARFLELL